MSGEVKFNAAELAALIRYVVETEKARSDCAGTWKIPAIKALRTIKCFDLRTAKLLVESTEPVAADPVVTAINQLLHVY